MQFSRVGQHTIRCVISEDEISDLGFSVDEIVTNGMRTQEFMNQIFDLAEQEFETKFDMGVKTVQVEFRSDHTLSLTFSEHPSAEGMMEHLRDIVNGILGSIPQEKWEAIQEKKQEQEGKVEPDVQLILRFDHIEEVIRFAVHVKDALEEYPDSQLYREGDYLYLILHVLGIEDIEAHRLMIVTDEYAKVIEAGDERRAYLIEHGTALIGEHALQTLVELETERA